MIFPNEFMKVILFLLLSITINAQNTLCHPFSSSISWKIDPSLKIKDYPDRVEISIGKLSIGLHGNGDHAGCKDSQYEAWIYRDQYKKLLLVMFRDNKTYTIYNPGFDSGKAITWANTKVPSQRPVGD